MENVGRIELFNALHGHKNFREKKLNDRLVDYVTNSLELDLPFESMRPKSTKRGFRRDSKDFMTSYYRLHDVGYLSDEKVEDAVLYFEFSRLKELADYYNSLATFVDPYKIPIEYTDDSDEGLLCVQSIPTEDDDETTLKLYGLINVFFKNYSFGRKNPLSYTTSLTHEVTHTQLESHKGIIRDFYNGEVISIFNELLQAYNTNRELFLKLLANRVFNNSLERIRIFSPTTNEFDKALAFRYVYSSLKAFQLLELYINGNSGIKREIISSIQSNFDGDNLVEDTLSKFDINTRSCTSINKVKRLIR